MQQRIIYVGLDVHKDTIAVALAEAGKRGAEGAIEKVQTASTSPSSSLGGAYPNPGARCFASRRLPPDCAGGSV